MPETLIVRLPNWLGDTVMAVPTVRALGKARRRAKLVLAGPWSGLFVDQDVADVLVAYPRAWSGRLRAADTVRALGADVVLLLPNSFESAASAWYWRAKRRIGFSAGGRDWLLTDRVTLPAPRLHQIDEYRMLLEPLGVRSADTVPVLTPPPCNGEARKTVRALLAEAGAAAGPRIGVHLGAAFGPSKIWPVERIAEFCTLARRADTVPVLMGAPDDEELASSVTARTDVANLVGRDRPELLTALLSELDVVVCGDTGVGHLAAALGTPVVTLFGPTDWRLTAPRGPAEVVRHPTPCSPCFYRTCPIEHPCLRGIAAGDVEERVRHLLAVATERAR
jgi:heptosyltransferase-2